MSDTAQLTKALTGTAYTRMVQLRDEIREAIANKGLRASGRTQDSLRVYVDGDTVVLEGRAFFSALEYGSSAWTGRTGIRCTFSEFKQIIHDWASDKGLNLGQAKDFDKAVGAITMRIIKSGTRLHRNNGYLNVYDTLIDDAISDMSDMAGVEVLKAVDVVIDQWARFK